MSEKQRGSIGLMRWLIVGLAVTLSLVTVGLVVRALVGGPSPEAAPKPSAALDTPAPPVDAGSATPTATAEQPATDQPLAAAPADPSAKPKDAAEPPTTRSAALTTEAANDAVSSLLSAVHDGDTQAGEQLVTADFLAVVGGAEWLGAGPDALKAWKITGARAENGFVWVSVAETWDYGPQKTQYMVTVRDGRILVDGAEWGF